MSSASLHLHRTAIINTSTPNAVIVLASWRGGRRAGWPANGPADGPTTGLAGRRMQAPSGGRAEEERADESWDGRAINDGGEKGSAIVDLRRSTAPAAPSRRRPNERCKEKLEYIRSNVSILFDVSCKETNGNTRAEEELYIYIYIYTYIYIYLCIYIYIYI